MGHTFSRADSGAPSSFTKQFEAAVPKHAADTPVSPLDPSAPWYRRIARTQLPFPGIYEELNNDAALVLRPNLFDGLSFSLNIPVSPAFTLGHTLDLGSNARPNNYAFAANYFSNALVLISRIDLTGRIFARAFINHSPTLTSKFVGDLASDPNTTRLTYDFDYRAPTSSVQLKLGSGPIAGLSFLQSVTPSLAVGAELFYQHKSAFSALTAALKYASTDGLDIAALSVASFGPIVASYARKVNPRVTLATELFHDARTRDSMVTAGYKFELKSATVYGCVDSSRRIAALVEEKINPGLSFLVSGEIDYAKSEYKFGFGVHIGG